MGGLKDDIYGPCWAPWAKNGPMYFKVRSGLDMLHPAMNTPICLPIKGARIKKKKKKPNAGPQMSIK